MRLHSAPTYLRLMPDNFPVRESPRFFYVKMTLGDLVNPNSFILDIAFESSSQIHITLKHNKSLPFYQEQKLNDVFYHSHPYPHIPYDTCQHQEHLYRLISSQISSLPHFFAALISSRKSGVTNPTVKVLSEQAL